MAEIKPLPELADARLHRVEFALSCLLRLGVILSSVLILVGMLIILQHHWSQLQNPAALEDYKFGTMGFPRSLPQVFTAIGHDDGQGLVSLGLLVLVATPILRVIASVAAFIMQRDRIYIWLTLIVLALLLASFFVAPAK